MSTRPKPRPRPRPRPVQATSSTPQPSSSGVSGFGDASKPIDVDEDDRFIKNRGRTVDQWKRLNELSEEQKQKQAKDSDDDDSGVEMDSPQKRKHSKAGKKEKDKLPDWTKNADAIIISSDDEIDDSILRRVEDATATPGAGRNERNQATASTKKRQRSRSRSFTPPPQLSTGQIMHANDTVRRLLGAQVRSSSPIEIEDDDDNNTEDSSLVLEPELVNIKRKVAVEVMRQSATPGLERSQSPEDNLGPPTVALKVKWIPHPLNPNAKPQAWGFKLRRNDAFGVMFDEIADMASVLVDNVIVTYERKRIYPSASPHGIGVWAEAELEACDKMTYDYMRSRRYTSTTADDAPTALARGRSPTGPPPSTSLEESSAAGTEAESESEEDDTIRLTFRSATVKDITLKVRPTTKCSAILKAYLKKAGLSEQYPATPKAKGKKSNVAGPALAVDGDKLSPDDEIGIADLEDGDQVEVVGL